MCHQANYRSREKCKKEITQKSICLFSSNIGTEKANRFLGNLFLAFLPAAVVGLMTHVLIKKYLFNSATVAMALILCGVLILVIERIVKDARIFEVDNITPLLAL